MKAIKPSRFPRRPAANAQRGFTLIELMVSLVIGLIIMVALVAVYLNVSRTNTEMAKTNGMIESGRFTLDLLQEDVEHAGFWGGYVPVFDDFSAITTTWVADAPAVVPDPCLAYTTSNWNSTYTYALLGIPVQTYSGVPSGCTAKVANLQPNTDVLVVRHAEVCLPGVGNCEAVNNSKLYFQSSFCEAEVAAGAPRYILSNTATDFTLKARGCTVTTPSPLVTAGTVSAKRKFVSSIYYVRTYAVTAGDGIPTLMRASFNLDSGTPGFEDAQPLIEGIEGFVVDLGKDSQSRCPATAVDYTTTTFKVTPATCAQDLVNPANNTMPTNRGDGVPEAFIHCGSSSCTAAELRDVVAVKLYVLARSREAGSGGADGKSYVLGGVSGSTVTITPGTGDKFRRHLFQTTIRLHNVSGRRESP